MSKFSCAGFANAENSLPTECVTAPYSALLGSAGPCYPMAIPQGTRITLRGERWDPKRDGRASRRARGGPPALSPTGSAAGRGAYGGRGHFRWRGIRWPFDARKTRLSVPSAFRAVLARTGSGEPDVVLRPSNHSPCIDVWPKAAFEAEVERRLEGLDPFSEEYEDHHRRADGTRARDARRRRRPHRAAARPARGCAARRQRGDRRPQEPLPDLVRAGLGGPASRREGAAAAARTPPATEGTAA